MHHNRTQSSCSTFFLRYCKNNTNFLFWVLWTCMATSITIMPICRNFDIYLHVKYCKLVMLSNLRMLDHTHQMPKVLKLTCRKLWCLSTCKKSTLSLTSFLRYCKDLQTCYFVYFEHVWVCTTKAILPTCKNFPLYQKPKNQLHPPTFSGNIAKICKLLILGILDMTVSTCRTLQCLSACQ